jgi:hypothetical protein
MPQVQRKTQTGGEIVNISGMNIVISPYLGPIPKVQLSTGCPCTDGFRENYNHWLKEFFGTEEPMFILNGKLFTSTRGYQALRVDIEGKS